MYEKQVYLLRQKEFSKFKFTIHQYPNAIGLWRNEQESLLWMALNANPKCDFMEIGSFCGGSMALMCIGKQYHNTNTKVLSVDRNFIEKYRYDELAYEMFVKNSSKFPNMSIMLPYESNDLKDYKPERKISFAFIDGWHSFKGALLDFETVLPWLTDDALIAFHDTAQQPYTEEQLNNYYQSAITNYEEWMKEELPSYGKQTYNLDEVVTYISNNYNFEYFANPILDGTKNCLAGLRRKQ